MKEPCWKDLSKQITPGDASPHNSWDCTYYVITPICSHRRYAMRFMIIITFHRVNGSLTQSNTHQHPWKDHPPLPKFLPLPLLIFLCAVNSFAIAVAIVTLRNEQFRYRGCETPCAVNNFAIAVAIATLRNEQFRHRGCDSHFAQWTISLSRLRDPLRSEQFRHRGCDSHFAQWTISWSRLRGLLRMSNLSIIHREIQECTLDYTIIHIAVLLSRPNNGSHAFAVNFCHGTKWQIKFEKWFQSTYKRSEKKCFRYRKDVVQPLISL